MSLDLKEFRRLGALSRAEGFDVKALRKKHKLTQKQLAELTNYSLITVRFWEAGRKKIPPSTRLLLRVVDRLLERLLIKRIVSRLLEGDNAES